MYLRFVCDSESDFKKKKNWNWKWMIFKKTQSTTWNFQKTELKKAEIRVRLTETLLWDMLTKTQQPFTAQLSNPIKIMFSLYKKANKGDKLNECTFWMVPNDEVYINLLLRLWSGFNLVTLAYFFMIYVNLRWEKS